MFRHMEEVCRPMRDASMAFRARWSAPCSRPALFWLALRGKAGRFRRGSASLTGAGPGLQNRWRALRGVLGGFDSHALPPTDLTTVPTKATQIVANQARGRFDMMFHRGEHQETAILLPRGARMERKQASDFDPAVLSLFDQYVHGLIDRRGFLERVARFAVGGVTAAM